MEKINTAVNHNRLEPYLKLTRYNYSQAVFLDFIAFSTSYTTFNLPNSNSTEKWATRTYEQMSNEVGIKIRTLKSYMKTFCDEGFVKRTQKKYGSQVKLYFRATEKLLTLLNKDKKVLAVTHDKKILEEPREKKFNQSCTTNDADSVSPYINKDIKQNINIITPLKGGEKCGKDLTQKNQHQEFNYKKIRSDDKPYNTTPSIDKLFNQIGDRLSNLQKRTIWGALCKFHTQYKKQYAKSQEFVAWVCFAILNPTTQLKGCETTAHQINKVLKIARSTKGFNKPYGFHTHWDIGQQMKKDKIRKAANEQALKLSSNNKLMQMINDEPMAFSNVITKKSKDIWQDDSELKTLRCTKGKVEHAISAVSNEIKMLPSLYADQEHKELLKKMIVDLKIEKKQFQNEYREVITKIKVLEEGISTKKSLEWDATYEYAAC